MANAQQIADGCLAYRALEPVIGIRLEKISFFDQPGRRIFEVLSQLHHPERTERFFQQLSTRDRGALFLAQLSYVITRPEEFTLNLSVALLLTDTFIRMLLMNNNRQHIVIEIQDPQSLLPLNTDSRLRVTAVIKALQQAGYRVWLDDLHPLHFSGWSQLGIWFDAIKIDHQLFRQLCDLPARLSRLVEQYRRIGQCVVIEGVETREDYAICRQSGASAVQGFLFKSQVLSFK